RCLTARSDVASPLLARLQSITTEDLHRMAVDNRSVACHHSREGRIVARTSVSLASPIVFRILRSLWNGVGSSKKEKGILLTSPGTLRGLSARQLVRVGLDGQPLVAFP